MDFDVFTLFPGIFQPYLEASILQRAIERELLNVTVHDIRDWAPDKHHITDEPPYGGGGGMVMKPGPIFSAIESVLGPFPECPVILMSPQGRPFNQKIARELASLPHIAILCGRYEGIDERVREHLVTDELSIGDFVLTGGELPALVVIDAVARFLPGVLGDPDGAMDDSFAMGLLEYPHYTRPEEFRGWKVPDILLSGDHAKIARWRREQAILRTFQRRPDLLEKAELTQKELDYLKDYLSQIQQQEKNQHKPE
ncbi:MAG: tRNA (guanosine(37)-N1)-methyltransferase TrmD [Anaerolineaceae bacterium]